MIAIKGHMGTLNRDSVTAGRLKLAKIKIVKPSKNMNRIR